MDSVLSESPLLEASNEVSSIRRRLGSRSTRGSMLIASVHSAAPAMRLLFAGVDDDGFVAHGTLEHLVQLVHIADMLDLLDEN